MEYRKYKSNGNRFFVVVMFLFLLTTLTGCFDRNSKSIENSKISSAINTLYLDFGVATEIITQQIIGKHYLPKDDSWKVISCTEFVLQDQNKIKDCNDSFTLYKLDTGNWILSGSVNGQYRWLQVK